MENEGNAKIGVKDIKVFLEIKTGEGPPLSLQRLLIWSKTKRLNG